MRGWCWVLCVCLVCGLVVVEPLFKFFKELCAGSFSEKKGVASSGVEVFPESTDGCSSFYLLPLAVIVPRYSKLCEVYAGVEKSRFELVEQQAYYLLPPNNKCST